MKLNGGNKFYYKGGYIVVDNDGTNYNLEFYNNDNKYHKISLSYDEYDRFIQVLQIKNEQWFINKI